MLPLLAGLVLSALGAAHPASDPAAVALLRRIEAHNRGVHDLEAQFTQTYRSGALGREVVESGRMFLKPPGRMLWEYRKPEKKTFVCDGKTFYFYIPADRQVIVRDGSGDRGVAVALLSGASGLVERFDAAFESAPDGGTRLRLVPREPDPDVTRVFLEVDARARITSLEVVDVQGNRSRFSFEGIRENVGLKDALFHFEIPKGVEVVAG